MRYSLNPQLHEIPDDDQPDTSEAVISLLTTDEFLTKYKHLKYYSMICRDVKDHNLEYCKAEVLPGCITGTMLIPDKSAPLHDAFSFSYYLTENTLILIDSREHLDFLVQILQDPELYHSTSIFHFFLRFLEYFIRNDVVYLQNFEKRLSTIEDSILETLPKEVRTNIVAERRALLVFRSYYQQLQDVCETIAENSEELFAEDAGRHFTILAGRAERLYNHTQTLRDYALQIQEMHQAQVDIRQNDTMRILTVVTTIFMPLTLIAGWYGMNFVNMPETQSTWGYFIVILISVLIVCLEIWFFRKKGWM